MTKYNNVRESVKKNKSDQNINCLMQINTSLMFWFKICINFIPRYQQLIFSSCLAIFVKAYVITISLEFWTF